MYVLLCSRMAGSVMLLISTMTRQSLGAACPMIYTEKEGLGSLWASQLRIKITKSTQFLFDFIVLLFCISDMLGDNELISPSRREVFSQGLYFRRGINKGLVNHRKTRLFRFSWSSSVTDLLHFIVKGWRSLLPKRWYWLTRLFRPYTATKIFETPLSRAREGQQSED